MSKLNHSYKSILKTHIENFIAEKQGQGYAYHSQAYLMKNFDSYWAERGYSFIGLTPASLDDWIKKRDSEEAGYLHNRIAVIREFSKYLNGIGIISYIPPNVRRSQPLVHVLCDEEITDLFEKIDNYIPGKKNATHIRMASEYPLLFRLIYCCGLRRSEACLLPFSRLDLEKGIITIINAKGDKDRLVYLTDDICQRFKAYLSMMCEQCGDEPEWVFPGNDIDKPLAPATAGRVFNGFWRKTRFYGTTDIAPTIHSLRHTFVVKRINLWMREGIDMNVMLPYLSKYLGHKSMDETYYYYHYVHEAAQIIRNKDTVAGKAIPKARRR